MRASMLAACATVAALVASGLASSAAPSAAGDVRALAEAYQRSHPSPYASTPRARFRAETNALAARAPKLSRPQLVVGLMRLLALAGARNGHTAIYPYDEHPRPLRVFPVRLYAFPTGCTSSPHPAVTRSSAPASPRSTTSRSTGSSLPYDRSSRATTGDGARPAARVRAHRGGSRRARPDRRRLDETRLRGRSQRDPRARAGIVLRLSRLDPRRAAAAERSPACLAPLPGETQWLTTLDRGRAVYLGYHLTTDETYTVSRRILALAAKPRVRRVVVDIRLNHGGDNTTYGALLDVMGRLSKTRSVSLLIGRATFSAAGNFAADVDALPRVRLIGEATGGAPSQWGDSTTVELPASG